MSADAVVVFYGAQVAIPANEVELCENKRHPLMLAARAAGLDTYWADFIPDDSTSYEMLVGRRWGVFGVEDSSQVHIERNGVVLAMNKVDAFLVNLGFPMPGHLIVRHLKDS